ncbi:MAG: hypothetical protein EOP09_10080 [Proteobacteria bacterium]|nr:MAG: hypothetical protein EOP09_10080 [Pseudomonadota bacterium]
MHLHVHRTTALKPFRYTDLLKLQEQAFETLKSTDVGSLLIAEVEPIITLGRRGSVAGLLMDDRALYMKQGIEILEVNRGGEATYHGPGIAVVFLVEKLERLVSDSKAVRELTEKLLGAGLQAVQALSDAPFEMRSGSEVGLWKSSRPEKIASLGIELRQRILLHGMAFNLWKEGPSFFGLNPCALPAARPGYVFHSTDPGHFPRALQAIVEAFSQAFCLNSVG